MVKTLGQKAAKGAVWASVDRFGMTGVHFLANLILARLLVPDDYGIIGMLTIFLSVSQVLIDGGFNAALIQKKEPTQRDYSTVFFWKLAVAIILYGMLFLIAPSVARFFRMEVLSDVLKAIGVSLIFYSILSVQTTRLKKMLSFKLISIVDICVYVVALAVAVVLAYKGYGVWSLVSVYYTQNILGIILFALITKWYPSLCISRDSLRELSGFGKYMMAATVLQEIGKNLQGVIIGKKFSAAQMGYYSQASKLDQVASYSLSQSIVQALFPVFSTLQDDPKALGNIMATNVRVISFMVFPLEAMLIFIASPLIGFLYGNNWVPCAPYFQILCLSGLFACLQNVNYYAVAAVGRSRTLFYWSFYKWGFLIVAMLVGMNFGIMGILWAMLISSANIFILNALLAHKHVGYTFGRQLRDLMPSALISLASVVVIVVLRYFIPELHPVLIVLIFALVYLGLAFIFKVRALADTFKIVRNLFSK